MEQSCRIMKGWVMGGGWVIRTRLLKCLMLPRTCIYIPLNNLTFLTSWAKLVVRTRRNPRKPSRSWHRG